MHRAVLAAFAMAAALSAVEPANRAAAMAAGAWSEPSLVKLNANGVQIVDAGCDWRCARKFPPRHYWQWDDRPIWDDPWAVLEPNFWGSPEPHLVPADIWACEWHLPATQSWRRHRRQCPAWQ